MNPGQPPASNGSTKHALRYLHRGQTLLRSGELQEAMRVLQTALDADPKLAAAYYELGNALRQAGKLEAAEQSLKKAIYLEPDHVDAHISLAFHYQTTGRLDKAVEVLRYLADNTRVPIPALYRAAAFLSDFRQFKDAAWVLEQADTRKPLDSALHARLGQLYQKIGRYMDAERELHKSVTLDADAGAAYMLLASNRKMSAADRPLLENFEAVLARDDISQTTRACLHFALGKINDDLGNYVRAFTHYREGNQIRRTEASYDRVLWADFFKRIRQVLTRECFPTTSAVTNPDQPIPVFVVGMLRSGTTLVERILAGHDAIVGAGELELLGNLADHLAHATGEAYPECLLNIPPEQFSRLAAEYRAQWPVPAGKHLYVVDKNPLNFMHLGLAHLLFPNSRVIHCKRDAMDTCLSIYFQNFAHPRNNYAYDLDDIGHFYNHYRDLMTHWATALPLPVTEVRYEELVSAPEKTGKHIIESLGLEWQAGCLDVHTQPDSISTASIWQARQPIYESAIGRSEHYRAFLEPLRMALQLPEKP